MYSWIHDEANSKGIIIRFFIDRNTSDPPVTTFEHYVSNVPITLINTAGDTSISPAVVLGSISNLIQEPDISNAGISTVSLFNSSDFDLYGLNENLVIGTKVQVIVFDINNITYDDLLLAGDNSATYCYTIFTGVVSNKKISDQKLDLSLASKALPELSEPLSPDTYPNNTEVAKNVVKPFCYGSCHNISPVLVSESGNWVDVYGNPQSYNGVVYQIHGYGSIQGITEVRENGNVLSPSQYQVILYDGLLVISSGSPGGHGTITCDVVGATGSNPITIVSSILTRALDLSDIDGTEIENIRNTYYSESYFDSCGVYITDSTSKLSVIDKVLSSISCYLYISEEGKVSIAQYNNVEYYDDFYSGAYWDFVIDTEIIVQNSFKLYNYENPYNRVGLLYNKNYTVQSYDALADILTQDEKDQYVREYDVLEKEVVIPDEFEYAYRPTYNNTEVLFTNETAANSILNKLASEYNKERKQLSISIPYSSKLELGQILGIQVSTADFTPKYRGTVTSIKTDLVKYISTVELRV